MTEQRIWHSDNMGASSGISSPIYPSPSPYPFQSLTPNEPPPSTSVFRSAYGLSVSPDLVGATYDSSLKGVASDFARSFGYSFFQAPYNGARQLLGHTIGDVLPELQLVSEPKPAPFLSPNGVGQLFGSALGMVLPFSAFARGVSLVSRGASSVLGLSGAAVDFVGTRAVVNSAVTGGLYSGIFQEVNDDAHGGRVKADTFALARVRNILTGGMTFGAMGLVGAAFARTSDTVARQVVIGAGSGALGGAVHATSDSLLSGQGLPSQEKIVESAVGFALVGGGLGLLHDVPGFDLESSCRSEAKKRRIENDRLHPTKIARQREFAARLGSVQSNSPEYYDLIHSASEHWGSPDFHDSTISKSETLELPFSQDRVLRVTELDGSTTTYRSTATSEKGSQHLLNSDGSEFLRIEGEAWKRIKDSPVTGNAVVEVIEAGHYGRTVRYSDGTIKSIRKGMTKTTTPDGQIVFERPRPTSSGAAETKFAVIEPDGSAQLSINDASVVFRSDGTANTGSGELVWRPDVAEFFQSTLREKGQPVSARCLFNDKAYSGAVVELEFASSEKLAVGRSCLWLCESDGTKTMKTWDGETNVRKPGGYDEWVAPDGQRHVSTEANGVRTTTYSDGRHSVLSLTDNRLKTRYPDGSIETKDSDGSIWRKNADGSFGWVIQQPSRPPLRKRGL